MVLRAIKVTVLKGKAHTTVKICKFFHMPFHAHFVAKLLGSMSQKLSTGLLTLISNYFAL